ncbi:MAG: hypothetical protein ACTSU0_00045 [Alphaproteobacteria bacterium]
MTKITMGDIEMLASAAPVIDEIRGREGASIYRAEFTPTTVSESAQLLPIET